MAMMTAHDFAKCFYCDKEYFCNEDPRHCDDEKTNDDRQKEGCAERLDDKDK